MTTPLPATLPAAAPEFDIVIHGATISGGKGTAADKKAAMKKAGVHVCDTPSILGATMKKVLGK